MTPFLQGFSDELVKVGVALLPARGAGAAMIPRRGRPAGGWQASIKTMRMEGDARQPFTRNRPDLGVKLDKPTSAPAAGSGGGGRSKGKAQSGLERDRLPYETNAEKRRRLAGEAAFNKNRATGQGSKASTGPQAPLPHKVQAPMKAIHPGVRGTTQAQGQAYVKAKKSAENFTPTFGPAAPPTPKRSYPTEAPRLSSIQMPPQKVQSGAFNRMQQQKLKL